MLFLLDSSKSSTILFSPLFLRDFTKKKSARHRIDSPDLCDNGTQNQWTLNLRPGLDCRGETFGGGVGRLQGFARQRRGKNHELGGGDGTLPGDE